MPFILYTVPMTGLSCQVSCHQQRYNTPTWRTPASGTGVAFLEERLQLRSVLLRMNEDYRE